MKKNQMANSLGNDGARYVTVQARVYPNQELHFQGYGEIVNRDYGFAENVANLSSIEKWFEGNYHSYPSLAGTSARYMTAQARIVGSNVRVQIHGQPSVNCPFGIQFEFPVSKAPNLATFVRTVEKINSVSALDKNSAIKLTACGS